MRGLVQALSLLVCLAFASSLAAAQTASQPLFAYRNGDLWKYDQASASAAKLTHWGYNGGPILSPDGSRIAFLSTTAAFIRQHEAGEAEQTGGSAPADIWVMDAATGSFSLIADQSGASASGILRSLPNWSPDSRKLAWLQVDAGAQSLDAAQLMLRDLDSGLTSTLASPVDLGYQGGNIRMPSLRWGDGGIARLHFDRTETGGDPSLYIQFYDPGAGAMEQYDLALNASRDNSVRDFEWVDHGGRSLMALQIKDYWDLLDPQTGARSRLSDPPRLRSRDAAGLQLIPLSVATVSGDWRIHWQATDGAASYDTGYRSSRVNRNNRPALSADGGQMAWQNAEGVYSWHIGIDGSRLLFSAVSSWSFPIPQPFGLVWAPTRWVTTGTLQGAQAAPVAPPVSASCSLPPLLSPGQSAIVSPGSANRVRGAASVNADIVGAIQEGEVVSIEAGPICADGYNWYFARGSDIAGWTAEGGAGDYWLLYHIDCYDSPPTRLSATMTATVAGNRRLNARNGKGEAGTAVIASATASDTFLITGRPECDWTGGRWYPIQIRGLLGWIAAGRGDEYYLEAAD